MTSTERSSGRGAEPARITPRTLKGFRDFLPSAMMPREQLIETARRVYRSYGFSPIDTPALEYLEVLTGKGGEETDRQLYQFVDQGGRHVGMRFDLTVPLARFCAQHINELGTPFKRYHIAPVWRGENTHRGRYREFMQCDFDTIGTRSVVADIETVLVINDLMIAIGFDQFTIHLNNRQVLNGMLEKMNLADRSVLVLRALDKLAKIGPDQVARELQQQAGISAAQASGVLELVQAQGSPDTILAAADKLVQGSEPGEAGVANLRDVLAGVQAAGVPAERVCLDLSIARGLDYYTGIVLETFLGAMPSIGSVCSGGRYDNLAGLFTNQQLPGIGASLGLDRLLAAMQELDMTAAVRTPAAVLITYFCEDKLAAYLKLAALVRAAGISVEIYPDARRLGKQLKYADQRRFRVALIAGEQELANGTCQVKDLRTGQSQEVTLDRDGRILVDAIEGLLELPDE